MRGVGGTRNCDWWFTDEAVLIDTAGRYTTQDSATAGRCRRLARLSAAAEEAPARQPLNGVLLADQPVRPGALLSERRTAGARTRHAPARSASCTTSLGVRIPVYVLFTKADLIAGFVEFFDNLGRRSASRSGA